ncbi:hypothetical protein LEN26_018226 [Aphanomyces euteiches]|nr:hypothetical protein LEN26_018226 [Aphanomyces euteiches]KAH9125601.1 hypothetical protein AeMF1_003815 [Aphanomyces euteiches]
MWWWAGLYGPMAVLSLYRLWLNWKRDRAAMAMYVNILVGSICALLGRCVFETASVPLILWLADMFLIVALLLIVYNWSLIARRMDTMSRGGPTTVMFVYIILTVVVYTMDAMVFVVNLVLPRESHVVCVIHAGVHATTALLSSMSLILFPYYGHRMRCVLIKVGEDSPKRMCNLLIISIVTAAFFGCHTAIQVLETIEFSAACPAVAWPTILATAETLATLKGGCILLLLLFLPWKPAPSRTGYLRLHSSNA